MSANIYYDPEKFGLEIVAEYETGGSYEFCTTLLFRLKASPDDVRISQDSGCSCPMPFENQGVDDLVPVSSVEQVRQLLADHHYDRRPSDETDFLAKVKEAVGA